MSWLKQYRDAVPHVPQDQEERLRLISESETRLAEIQDAGAKVSDVSGSLRARNDRNHFAQGLQAAFGGAGK